MDMKDRSTFCDYFVVMSAPSSVRVKAIVDSIEKAMENEGFRTRHREGYAESAWVLLDYGEVVAHIFYHETRKFYDLENLWGDAPKRSYFKS
jgi:ribosome-associated protein